MLRRRGAAILLCAGQPPGALDRRRPEVADTEQNKAVVRDCYVYASQGDAARLSEILDSDFVIHTPEDHHGVDGLLGMVGAVKAGLPDLKVTIDAQFADGDYVATRFTARGTHDGDLFGTPATGREVELSGITISRCADGRIAEEWELVDAVGALQQIGALGAPASA
ncbi:MAG TPA: ester cyclase [Thermoleophilaceae bacterium]